MSQAKLTIRANFQRPANALVEAFRTAPTGPVADALGRYGALDHTIRPLTTATRFVGTALTVWTVPRDNLAPYAALKFAKPGDVLMVASAGEDEAAIMGDIAIGMAKNAGIVAVVTDGLVRDIDGIEAVGIPVFARGLTPNSPFKNGPGTIGLPIALGRVAIAPGDIVVGDKDGVVVVPQGRAEAAKTALATVLAKEADMEKVVAAGTSHPAWLDSVLDGEDVEFVEE
ncbi:MAG: hypothetical protein AAGD34_05530 [Pseudomonadota bacterium]